jgi:exosome complex RNA-binding protein Csl4
VSTTEAEPAKTCETSRFAIFAECPHCGGDMAPEHAHYRCTSCGWRDSCCD